MAVSGEVRLDHRAQTNIDRSGASGAGASSARPALRESACALARWRAAAFGTSGRAGPASADRDRGACGGSSRAAAIRGHRWLQTPASAAPPEMRHGASGVLGSLGDRCAGAFALAGDVQEPQRARAGLASGRASAQPRPELGGAFPTFRPQPELGLAPAGNGQGPARVGSRAPARRPDPGAGSAEIAGAAGAQKPRGLRASGSCGRRAPAHHRADPKALQRLVRWLGRDPRAAARRALALPARPARAEARAARAQCGPGPAGRPRSHRRAVSQKPPAMARAGAWSRRAGALVCRALPGPGHR